MPEKQYSSFQIARILNVSRQAVNQWIDKGYIASYRTPGGHRRVAARDLLSFINTRGIPVPADLRQADADSGKSIASASSTAFWLDQDVAFLERHLAPLRLQSPSIAIRSFPNPCDLLLALIDPLPDLLLLAVHPDLPADTQLINALRHASRVAAIPRILIVADEVVGRAEGIWGGRGDIIRARNRSADLIEALIEILQKPAAEVYS
jgi:excisionase family DNA binding protein